MKAIRYTKFLKIEIIKNFKNSKNILLYLMSQYPAQIVLKYQSQIQNLNLLIN